MRPDIRLSLLLILLICIAISWTPTAPAVAEPLSATNAITAQAGPTNTGIPAAATDAAATKELIDTLKDPDRRAVLIATLENLRKSMPSATQAAIPGSQRSASGNPVGALKLGSFGAKLFANGAHFLRNGLGQFAAGRARDRHYPRPSELAAQRHPGPWFAAQGSQGTRTASLPGDDTAGRRAFGSEDDATLL